MFDKILCLAWLIVGFILSVGGNIAGDGTAEIEGTIYIVAACIYAKVADI